MKDRKKKRKDDEEKDEKTPLLHPDIKKSVLAILLVGFAVVLLLAAANQAGPIGKTVFQFLTKLFGVGYYLLPLVSILFALSLTSREEKNFFSITLIGGLIFILSGLGLIDIFSTGNGGLTGGLVGLLQKPFGVTAAVVILLSALAASLVVVLNRPLKLSNLFASKEKKDKEDKIEITLPIEASSKEKNKKEETEEKPEENKKEKEPQIVESVVALPKNKTAKPIQVLNYVPPPPDLLASAVEKPTIGDLRSNANIIKRTLESFGIPVEMGEINVGPSVTRYTLKPAEGVKLSRITALHQDLALALAAHPIRIEAPIPGKSLVGIEVPNKVAALVRLGSLILYPEFQEAGSLTFALGRNVSGDPVFADIAKMPHMLVAGATGSGKSIAIHSLIISLLYKNSPQMMRMILVDPKRVELSIYNGIPHLLSPVITENKKAIGALRWAIQEMDRRYLILMEAGSRDIKSYNKQKDIEPLPYIVIVIDELADIMATYGREVEGSIIRLAQMARATGIHLIVSTQRPSVEVITGLIKANITSRIALQVASQIDSRTILDSAGAEKLLGHGDLLFITSELSKPKRIQGSFLTEDEIKKVSQFIKKNNPINEETAEEAENISETVSSLGEKAEKREASGGGINFEDYGNSDEDDELYEEAVETVREAQKASASLLQRRLRIGYARAARLIDIMEERGVVGPGEGAKPRDVLL